MTYLNRLSLICLLLLSSLAFGFSNEKENGRGNFIQVACVDELGNTFLLRSTRGLEPASVVGLQMAPGFQYEYNGQPVQIPGLTVTFGEPLNTNGYFLTLNTQIPSEEVAGWIKTFHYIAVDTAHKMKTTVISYDSKMPLKSPKCTTELGEDFMPSCQRLLTKIKTQKQRKSN